MSHTNGPWKLLVVEEGFEIRMASAVGLRSGFECQHRIKMDFSLYPEDGEQYNEALANARLISEAPAMDLALALIACGAARIESLQTLREFCFGGLRYCMNESWSSLFNMIGWDVARAALAKVTGGQP